MIPRSGLIIHTVDRMESLYTCDLEWPRGESAKPRESKKARKRAKARKRESEMRENVKAWKRGSVKARKRESDVSTRPPHHMLPTNNPTSNTCALHGHPRANCESRPQGRGRVKEIPHHTIPNHPKQFDRTHFNLNESQSIPCILKRFLDLKCRKKCSFNPCETLEGAFT